MLMVMHPTYRLSVEIKDEAAPQTSFTTNQIEPYNGHRFFNGHTGKTGCDEALAAVKDALEKAGLKATVFFEQFKHSV